MVRDYDPEAVPAVYTVEDIPPAEREDGMEQRLFRGLDTMVGFSTIEPGEDDTPHSHPWEQITYVVEGRVEFHAGGEVETATAGDILVVPPCVDHRAEPLNGTATVMFVGPLREDRLDDVEYQLEFPG